MNENASRLIKKLESLVDWYRNSGEYEPIDFAQDVCDAWDSYDLREEIDGRAYTDPDEKITVEVRGGVAYCDNPRVKIIDYDNQELE